MVPIQEVDIYTDGDVFFKMQIVARPTKGCTIFIEVLVNESESNRRPLPRLFTLDQEFQDSEAAFAYGLRWLIEYSTNHSYTITRINNPCNCEFLSQEQQQQLVQSAGLRIQIQVNGV